MSTRAETWTGPAGVPDPINHVGLRLLRKREVLPQMEGKIERQKRKVGPEAAQKLADRVAGIDGEAAQLEAELRSRLQRESFHLDSLALLKGQAEALAELQRELGPEEKGA